jgi:hypothetical protein
VAFQIFDGKKRARSIKFQLNDSGIFKASQVFSLSMFFFGFHSNRTLRAARKERVLGFKTFFKIKNAQESNHKRTWPLGE